MTTRLRSCRLCGQPSAWEICGECDAASIEADYGKTIEELDEERRASWDDEMDRRAHQAMEEERLW